MNLKYSKDELINELKILQAQLGNNRITKQILIDKKMYSSTKYYWGSIKNMQIELEFPKRCKNVKEKKIILSYTKDEVIQAYINYYNDNGHFPTTREISKISNLPGKCFIDKYFDSYLEFQKECGVLPPYYIINKNNEIVKEYDNAEFLKNLILKYVNEYGKVPKMKELNKYYGVSLSRSYKTFWGSYNNCVSSLGLTKHTREYTEDELKDAFMNFVNKYNRTPACNDFNNSEYPSYKTYQDHFGSWVNACIYYGVKPNCRKPEYYLDDGERCDSRYEVDISHWLKANGYNYTRNVPYTNIDDRYTGSMNCDYKIFGNNVWYIEIAGFIRGLHENHYSTEELKYREKLLYKIKMLERSNVKYKIFYRKELDENDVETLFSFLIH